MNNLKSYYQKKFKKHGPVLKGVGWSENKKSKKRYLTVIKLLDQIADKKKTYSLLDIGCGYGELIKYLPKKYKLTYRGIDIVKDMIKYAKKKHNKKMMTFQNIDFFKIKKKHDFIICNGVFTLKNNLSYKKMDAYFFKSIRFFYKLCNIGFCFNIMSDEVDYKSKILYYPKLKLVINELNQINISKIYVDNVNVKYENFVFVKK